MSGGAGAEGLVTRNGEGCLLADTPEEFAARVLELLADDRRQAELAERARALVVSQKDMDSDDREVARELCGSGAAEAGVRPEQSRLERRPCSRLPWHKLAQ